MTKRMLIDASQPEETRVVVLDGSRIEEFDIETANRRPLKGNIYLAKVVRVEPSLQAAFVEYGGGRHGFLAFGEIHPDYYQIPVADRQRLLEMQAREAEEDEGPEDEIETAAERLAPHDDKDLNSGGRGRSGSRGRSDGAGHRSERGGGVDAAAPGGHAEAGAAAPDAAARGAAIGETDRAFAESEADATGHSEGASGVGSETGDESGAPLTPDAAPAEDRQEGSAPGMPSDPAPAGETGDESGAAIAPPSDAPSDAPSGRGGSAKAMAMAVDRVSADEEAGDESEGDSGDDGGVTVVEKAPPPETIGGPSGESEEHEDDRPRRVPSRWLRNYKIQEVIRRRQIMLVQVVKEERGNKGAALTTYISLAGRFSVLMPNSPKGGGVSRKISSAGDRKRLREVIDELGLPRGMGIIVRTAGAQRPKPEIRRDCEYLLRLWDNIRERTLASTAPALVYEEADLLKRSIRDNFARDIEEITIEGDDAFQEAREFMRALMPQQEKKVRLYRDSATPLFARAGVEAQLDAMMSPVVQLKSGGYIVINQTEALVSIDVNSGRATRDRHIEDTALRTNLEAADEIARQLRLRDLAGLIVIDFIDMESSRNDAMVEKRMKDALRLDRARIQVGRISHFGLLEMSRQRLRPSLTEHSFVTCQHCQGLGIVRSAESAALAILRAIDEEGAKRRAAEVCVHLHPELAMHILNRKRERLMAIEERHSMCVLFQGDPSLHGTGHRIERTRAQVHAPLPERSSAPALRMDYAPEAERVPEEVEDEVEEAAPEEVRPAAAAGAPEEARAEGAATGEGGERRGRRRRRRRGRREIMPGGPEAGAENGAEVGAEGEDDEAEGVAAAESEEVGDPAGEDASAEAVAEGEPEASGEERGERGGRRRGRRGGRRRPEGEEPAEAPVNVADAAPRQVPIRPAPPPRYVGPTPADPFAGTYDHLMEAMEAVEEAAARPRTPPVRPAVPVPVTPAVVRDTMAEAVAVPAAAGEAVPDVTAGAVEPAQAAPAAPAATLEVAAVAPEPVAAETPAPAPAPAEEVRAEPVAAPPVQPVVLGADAPPPAAPKRGWWRR
ncbi:Rne/Rng family ribonuclease [Roseomonas sp. CCTCC AB2023176]|uniref:Rne/Rng family ribonuclease n=1 Tax=Roseomonas sp. CCTCC AB2023176 TaxID=3342640 RepID=UPI0035D8D062